MNCMKKRLGLRLRRRPAFARRRFGKCVTEWGSSHIRSHKQGETVRKPEVLQLDYLELLFGLTPGLIEVPKPRKKRRQLKRRRRAKGKNGVKGAFIPRVGETKNLALVVRSTDRKVAFRTHAPDEQGGNTEFVGISDEALRRLHYVLLVGSLRYLKECAEIASPRVAEVWEWIQREGQEEPFSFDACVLIAAELSVAPDFRDPFPDVWEEDKFGRRVVYRRGVSVDFAGATPASLREAIKETLTRRYPKGIPPHADVCRRMLMRADLGDQEAIDWIAGKTDLNPSFAECSTALGFNAAVTGQIDGNLTMPERRTKARKLDVA